VKRWVSCFEKAKWIGIAQTLEEALANRNYIIFLWPSILIGVKLSEIHSRLVSTPLSVKWDDVGQNQALKFSAGIFELRQHSDADLEPQTRWAVVIHSEADSVT
jgi:hypothetical protein